VGRNALIKLMMDAGASSKSPCNPVTIVGDYHFSDFKMIRGGRESLYGSAYGIDSRSDSDYLIQIMASGMSHETAVPHESCYDYLVDYSGMRKEARQESCGIVTGPNFGRIRLDWGNDLVRLEIVGGDVDKALEADKMLAGLVLDMSDGCKIVEAVSKQRGDV